MAEIISTRKFGLEDLDLPVNFYNDFRRIVNKQIELGLNLGYSIFDKNSLTAVKQFYIELNTIYQDLNKNIQPSDYTIKERIMRCAAQNSYFALQGYRNNQRNLLEITPILIEYGWFGKKNVIYKKIIERTSLSNYEIDNKIGFLKNKLLDFMKSDFKEITFDQSNSFFSDQSEKNKFDISRLKLLTDANSVEKLKKKFMVRAITRMNARVKELRSTKYTQTSNYDEAILSILNLKSIDDVKKSTEKEWRTAKIDWKREIIKFDLNTLANTWNIADFESQLVLKHMLEEKQQRIYINAASIDEFIKFIHRHFEYLILQQLCIYIRNKYSKRISQHLYNIFNDLETQKPICLKVPEFSGNSIPLGIGEDVVYKLLEIRVKDLIAYRQSEKLSAHMKKIIAKINIKYTDKELEKMKNNHIVSVQILFSVIPGKFQYLKLRGLNRYIKIIKLGMTPQRGVLNFSKGKYILAIPFKTKANEKKEQGLIASADLGLKTISTLSIIDTKQNKEIERFFLDQKDLGVKKDQWFRRKSKKKPVYLKSKLMDHRLVARKEQSARAGLNRNSIKRWKHRRVEKAKWKKINNTHRELVRQISTRIVSMLQYFRVGTLVLENLKWAKHKPKYSIGYFLAHWQIHWFFSQIQTMLTEQCLKHGIKVELVNPAYSSKTCSKCGSRGSRKGKTFSCECGFTLDSDLNAARNLIHRSKVYKKLAKKKVP